MKAIDIIEPYKRDPLYKGHSSPSAYLRWVKRILEMNGHTPIRAVYDGAGNCIFCGEAGRCPGYHTEAETTAQLIQQDNAHSETRNRIDAEIRRRENTPQRELYDLPLFDTESQRVQQTNLFA